MDSFYQTDTIRYIYLCKGYFEQCHEMEVKYKQNK